LSSYRGIKNQNKETGYRKPEVRSGVLETILRVLKTFYRGIRNQPRENLY